MAEYSAAGELDHVNSNSSGAGSGGRHQRASVEGPNRAASAILQRNTSETLRLNAPPHIPQSVPDLKKSSFQITSVTVSSSVSNDGEDDSCGEVEDSQIEQSDAGDSINRTDAEEGYREDEEDNEDEDGPPSIGIPVVPAPQQQQVIQEGAKQLDAALGPRFKVVRIDNEPYRRGRWQCLDFLDQPSHPKEDLSCSGASSSGSLSEHAHTASEEATIPQQQVQHPPQTVLQYPTLPAPLQVSRLVSFHPQIRFLTFFFHFSRSTGCE